MQLPPIRYTFVLIAAVILFIAPRAPQANSPGVITKIEVSDAEKKLVIKTKGDPGKVVASVLRSPNRLVLDFPTASMGQVQRSVARGAAGVEAVRAANFKTGARVVADFQDKPVPNYKIQSQRSGVVVTFGVSGQGATAAGLPKEDPPPQKIKRLSASPNRDGERQNQPGLPPLGEWLSQGVGSPTSAQSSSRKSGASDHPQTHDEAAQTPRSTADQGWGEPAASNSSKPIRDASQSRAAPGTTRDLAQAPPMGSSQDLGSYPNLSPIPRRQVQPAGKPDQSRAIPKPRSIPDLSSPSSHVPVQPPRPPTVPPEPEPRLIRHEITDIKFIQVGHNSRLWIKASDDVDYRVATVAATKLKLDLINAEIPKKYQRPLRTDQWSTAVDMVIPGSHTIFIQMKEAVPYKVEKKKGVLMVDFAPPRLELPRDKASRPNMGPMGKGAAPGTSQQLASSGTTGSGSSSPGNGEPVDCESSVDCLKTKIEELAADRDKKKKTLTTPNAEILDKPITMDFQDIRLKNAFRLLSEQAGINITLDPDVDGTTTLRLHDIPLRDAIDTILATNDLTLVMVGDVIRVGKAEKINKFIAENKATVAAIEQRITAYRSKIKTLEDRKRKEENPTPIEGSIRTDDIGEAGCIKIDEEEICFYYATIRLTYAKPTDIQKILDCMFNMNCPGTAAGSGGSTQANTGATSVAEQKVQRDKRLAEMTERLQKEGFSPDSAGAASRLAQFESLDLDRQRADADTARAEAVRSRAGLGQLEDKRNPREREIIANSMLWPDDNNKMLFIKDTSDRISQMKQVIKSLDIPTPQVMIESRLVRASREWARELGVRWGGRNNQNGQIDNNKKAFWGMTGHQGTQERYGANTPTGTTLVPGGDIPSRFAVNLPAPIGSTILGNILGLGMQFGLLGTQYVSELDVRLEIGEGARQVKIIARPKVQVLDGEKAKILDGRDIPYVTTSGQQGTQTQLVPAYLQLEVTPKIYADGRVSMKLQVKDDDIGAIVPGANLPEVIRRQANTDMIVKDGETAVIGGIIKERNVGQRQGWPGLMNLPLFGYLFTNKGQEKELNELLIFITPSIIKRPPPAS